MEKVRVSRSLQLFDFNVIMIVYVTSRLAPAQGTQSMTRISEDHVHRHG